MQYKSLCDLEPKRKILTMHGWLLYKKMDDIIKPEVYEVRRIVETAEAAGITMRVLSPDQIDIIVFREDRNSILVDEVSTALPDFILPRMGAGTSYFALAVIRHLERMGVYSVNGSQSIENVRDKLYTLQILAEANLPIPKTILLKFPVEPKIVSRHLKFPVVVKTLSGTQGMGVFLSTGQESFEDLMQLIQATNKSANIILQEFIEMSEGRDLRVFVVGGRVVGAMERKARTGTFKANCSIGGTGVRYDVTPEIETLAIGIARILNLEIAGIDLLFDREGFKICEVNSAPGFEAMENFCGLDIAAEIIGFIQNR
jgi:gamma-F420-2:alpha-L-glutamate ligase